MALSVADLQTYEELKQIVDGDKEAKAFRKSKKNGKTSRDFNRHGSHRNVKSHLSHRNLVAKASQSMTALNRIVRPVEAQNKFDRELTNRSSSVAQSVTAFNEVGQSRMQPRTRKSSTSSTNYKGMTTAKMQKMAPGLGIETGKSQNLLESMGVKAPRTTVNRDADQDYKEA